MTTLYEWRVEFLDGPEPDADIIDMDEHATLAAALKQAEDCTDDLYPRVALVRITGNGADGVTDYQRALLDDGLPGYFEEGAKVPKRFHDEVRKIRQPVLRFR